jgi:hypothetical protein
MSGGLEMRGQTERFLEHIPRHRAMPQSGNVPSVPLFRLFHRVGKHGDSRSVPINEAAIRGTTVAIEYPATGTAPFLWKQFSLRCVFDFSNEAFLAEWSAGVCALTNFAQLRRALDSRSILGP